jgi:hypothetical protein
MVLELWVDKNKNAFKIMSTNLKAYVVQMLFFNLKLTFVCSTHL